MAKKPKFTSIKPNKNGVDLSKNKDKLDNTSWKKWVAWIVDRMKEGVGHAEIKRSLIAETKGVFSESSINGLFAQANIKITNSQFTKIEDVIPIHTARYNARVKRLLEVKDPEDLSEEEQQNMEWDAWYRMREKKIRAWNDIINTLVQKEEMLQFHNKDFTVEINIEETETVKEVKPKIDISKLSLEEQIELLQLIKKARKSDFEMSSIVQSADQQQVTEDVKHEVVELPNIEKIKQEEPKVDTRSKKNTREQLLEKLKHTQAKEQLQKVKDAGGKISDEEEQILKS